MSRSVATHVSHAKRLSHFLDLGDFPEFTLEKITADYADFADEFSVAIALWATQRQPSFTSARRFAHESGYSLGLGDAAGWGGLFSGCGAPGEGDLALCAPPASSARSFSQAS